MPGIARSRSSSRRLRSLALRLLLVCIVASARSLPVAAFEATDVVFDPATGLEWLKVSESLNRSYDDLVGADGSDEFAPGGDFAGFRHASAAEVEAFLGNAGFDALGSASTSLFDTALSLMLRWGGATFVSGDLDRTFAISGTSSIPGSRDRLLLSVDNAAGTGDARFDGGFDEGTASILYGHLLVREAAPLPQRQAWVARSGAAGIAVIDVATNTVIDTVLTARIAVALVVSPDQRRVYALNLSDSSISVIDTETRSVVATHAFTTAGFPRGLEISADGSELFITDQEDPGEVLVLDAETGDVIDTVAVEPFPYAIQRSADGSEMYVSSPNTREISVVDVDSLASVGASVNANVAQFALAVGAQTGLVYSSFGSTVHEVDPMSLTSTASVTAGADIRGLAASDLIGRVFASSNDDATVSVIDMDSFSVVTTIPTGTVALFGGILAPGLDVTREGDRVYAAQGNNDTVVAIDTLSNQVVSEIAAGDTPIDVVLVPEPGAGALAASVLACLLGLANARRRSARRAARKRAARHAR